MLFHALALFLHVQPAAPPPPRYAKVRELKQIDFGPRAASPLRTPSFDPVTLKLIELRQP